MIALACDRWSVEAPPQVEPAGLTSPHTAFATDTGVGQLAQLDARHRAHARVEDRIRCAKDTAWTTSRPGRSRSTKRGWPWSCSPWI